MPATIIIGAQWGDEGKGRAVDWLASKADVVARFSGGDNAGHTVFVGSDVLKLHLLPSGILHEQADCILGNGMVINPVNLIKEIDRVMALGIDVSPSRLLISNRAHLITPAHIAQDAAREEALGAGKIGTTLRGIGPAYSDKIARRGIRAGVMADPAEFADSLRTALDVANAGLARDGFAGVNVNEAIDAYLTAAHRLRPYLTDTTVYINQRLKEGARVVCEGAQGTLLDVDHGSYPFVTSSSPSVGGALAGLGFGPKYVDSVVGVAKAFSTRVGSGAMPTELNDELGSRLRGSGENFWDEYGTTTGRPRRTGWLDIVMLRYSAEVNGFTELLITKLDILSGLSELKLCVAYEVDGSTIEYPPASVGALDRAVPVFETLPGWSEEISNKRRGNDLPAAARAYIKRISELIDVPIRVVSVGPERDQLVHL
ncbi:MAG TPA: adenylosuccinate synthase [Aggregatilineales bacterium]|jgi:adenylosuccinate synthase|nr:adenylosuccinate synthase [Aggregatilineales bacterium]